MDTLLTQKFTRFLMQRADRFIILRRKAVPGYNISFLVTNAHLEYLVKAKLIDFIIKVPPAPVPLPPPSSPLPLSVGCAGTVHGGRGQGDQRYEDHSQHERARRCRALPARVYRVSNASALSMHDACVPCPLFSLAPTAVARPIRYTGSLKNE